MTPSISSVAITPPRLKPTGWRCAAPVISSAAARTFPYVLASTGATSSSRSWSIVEIDPKTGRFAAPGQHDALRVWAYRDRPVYTYAGDHRPGDIYADGIGEFQR